MPNRQTVCLLNITRPERSRGAGQVQSPTQYSAGYPRVSNGAPGSRCCPVRLSTYREEAAPMRSQPCRARQAVAVRRSSSRRQRKSIPKLRPTPLLRKPRPRKRRAYAHFGWPRKQPTRILQIATPRQRRPGDLSRAPARSKTSGLNPRTQVSSAQSPSRRLRCVAGDIGTVQIGGCW